MQLHCSENCLQTALGFSSYHLMACLHCQTFPRCALDVFSYVRGQGALTCWRSPPVTQQKPPRFESSPSPWKLQLFWMFLKHSRGRVCTTSLVRSPISWRWLEYRMRTVLCNCRGCSINGSQVTFRAFSAWAGCTADFYVVLVEWQDMLEKTDSTVGKSQGKWTGKYILFMMLNVVACYCIMCLRETWASPWYVLFWPCIRSVFSATCLALTGMFVAFVSHQWLGITHPDPAGTHTCFLRKALREVLSGSVAVESS